MKKIIIFISIYAFWSCKNTIPVFTENITKITVDTISYANFNTRAILILDNKLFYAANDSKMGFIDLTNKNQNGLIQLDTLKTEFRSIATNGRDIFVLSVSSPASLYKISQDLKSKELVYQDNHPDVFFDSMQFSNSQNGIAMSDPISDKFYIIKTTNGGQTWHKTNPINLPTLNKGEAAFAASNTNIVTKKNNIWLVSGGTKARVFYSQNNGKSWTAVNTPMQQGSAMTGIFSADFYDKKNGIIVGGNYDQPNLNADNKAITTNGGKTWKIIANNQAFGYASCVQYFPNSNKKKIVTVGLSGLFVSNDGGENWQKMLDNSNIYTIRFINNKTAIAAGKNQILKLTFQ